MLENKMGMNWCGQLNADCIAHLKSITEVLVIYRNFGVSDARAEDGNRSVGHPRPLSSLLFIESCIRTGTIH